MKLAHLTQTVLLDRGQADLVHNAVQQVHHELLHRDPTAGQRLSAVEALALKPLTKILLRLLTLAMRDELPAGRKAKPHKLKLEYDQLTTMRCFYARLLATAHEPGHHDQLATALARFHRSSLNLEGHVKLPAPTGPGCQGSLAE